MGAAVGDQGQARHPPGDPEGGGEGSNRQPVKGCDLFGQLHRRHLAGSAVDAAVDAAKEIGAGAVELLPVRILGPQIGPRRHQVLFGDLHGRLGPALGLRVGYLAGGDGGAP